MGKSTIPPYLVVSLELAVSASPKHLPPTKEQILTLHSGSAANAIIQLTQTCTKTILAHAATRSVISAKNHLLLNQHLFQTTSTSTLIGNMAPLITMRALATQITAKGQLWKIGGSVVTAREKSILKCMATIVLIVDMGDVLIVPTCSAAVLWRHTCWS